MLNRRIEQHKHDYDLLSVYERIGHDMCARVIELKQIMYDGQAVVTPPTSVRESVNDEKSRASPISQQSIADDDDSSVARTATKVAGTQRQIVCTFCTKSFPHEASILQHMRRVHASTAAVKHTPLPSSQQASARRTTLSKTYKCDECNKRYVGLGQLALHKIRVHAVSRTPADDVNTTNHGSADTEDNGLVDVKLTTALSTPETQPTQTEKKAPTIRKRHACDKCERSFQDGYKLRRHRSEVHDNVRNYRCSMCTRAFKRDKQLQRHVETHKPVFVIILVLV
jgi:uncharacterized Zn-finger protein